MNIPVTLAMTVTPENLPFLWAAIEFGLKFQNVRGICFQPMFGSGRIPSEKRVPRVPNPNVNGKSQGLVELVPPKM